MPQENQLLASYNCWRTVDVFSTSHGQQSLASHPAQPPRRADDLLGAETARVATSAVRPVYKVAVGVALVMRRSEVVEGQHCLHVGLVARETMRPPLQRHAV
jgi:hypothetical protein